MIESVAPHLSRLTLKRSSPDVRPLIRTLLPEDESAAMATQHRLMWSLFADRDFDNLSDEAPGNRSHFLWRQADSNGRFYLFGPEPRHDSPFFKVESRPFDVCFRKGQHLSFELRVNATVNRLVDPSKGRNGRKRCDVVMDALRKADGVRSEIREQVAHAALEAWMIRQGETNGFELGDFGVLSYRTVPLPKPVQKGRGVQIGVADLHGRLTVNDPGAFSKRLATGFGRFKAFGCGLMLVRPVAPGHNNG